MADGVGGDARDPAGYREERISLRAAGDAPARHITAFRFGETGARPKAYLQAGLHADELPGLLVLRRLTEMLSDAATRGEIVGDITLVPSANPIGLSQVKGGYMQGRVEDGTNRNFNRGFPDLAAIVGDDVSADLGDDPAANVARLRAAIGEGLTRFAPPDPFSDLQMGLVRYAYDADFVLDLHADNEALMHIYLPAAMWPDGQDLAAEVDARAILLCGDSGGAPFDETFHQVWVRLQERFPNKPIPHACLSATVELRSNNDVDAYDAERDARALFRFLQRRGVIRGSAGALPRLLAEPAPIEAMEQVIAPIEGLVVYRRRLGDTVRIGEVVAIIEPVRGEAVDVEAGADGILFARHDQPWAWAGKVIGKIGGRTPLPHRTGHLLTD